MRSDWIDDLIALADADSLTEAAARRNVTQPAFSRRVRAIEDFLGAPVIDRARRPARVVPDLAERIEELRGLSDGISRLRARLGARREGARRLVIAAQHALAIAVLPRALPRVAQALPGAQIRLRTANRDQCRALLLTREVAMALVMETDGLPIVRDEALVEQRLLGSERLIPVIAASRQDAVVADGPLALVSYPEDSFLGAVMERHVLPALGRTRAFTVACETALTPAVLQLVLAGWGAAWLPASMAAGPLARGELADLTAAFGAVPMRLSLLRLRTPRPAAEEAAWRALTLKLGRQG